MITDLLGKTVSAKNLENAIGKICAIYDCGGTSIYAAISLENGDIHSGISLDDLSLLNQKEYNLVLFWQPNQKIWVIKVLRDIHGPQMGLKEAKEFIESHPNCVSVKTSLTYDDAVELKRRIYHLNPALETEIRKEIQ